MPTKKLEYPNPAAFRFDIIISAIVIIILGVLIFIFASVVTGFVITLLGAIFGLSSQVKRNLPSD